ncbi:MAG: di-trans,poly-cis-decaprenylcistransferase [Opitutae bacterium]|jgi:undecaprenyl diphosphate synthase|nr:di-trans,poly-cis-decaprenylcistransferase [Opitutae bacterium]
MTKFSESERGKLPNHVAIIMDGNGRWARSRGKPRLFGHRNGVKNVRSVVNAAREFGVQYVTLYAFSTENQNRPDEEKSGLMRLLEEFLKRELATLLKDGTRLRAIGDLSGLPKFAQEIVESSIEKTKHNSTSNLTLALNYGSRQEVLSGIQSYTREILETGKSADQLDWSTFSNHLQTKDLPDPDLIIRTSGEFRLSNFLLLQAAYAEIFVSPLHWPDFNRDAFIEALQNYIQRERRFGKTSDQLAPINQNSITSTVP